MSLLRNCRIESVEKAIYIIDTLNLKGNQNNGYPLDAYKEKENSLVVEDSSNSLEGEKGGEEMAEWRPRKGLHKIRKLVDSVYGEEYYEIDAFIDWNDPDLDFDDEDILMTYQEYASKFGEFDFDGDEEDEELTVNTDTSSEKSSNLTYDTYSDFDSDFYADEEDEYEDNDYEDTEYEQKSYQKNESLDDDFDSDFYADEEDNFDDDFYADEDEEFDFNKVSNVDKSNNVSENSNSSTTKESIDIEELKNRIRQEVTKELQAKHDKEKQEYEDRIEKLKSLIVSKNEEIENYKTQLNNSKSELSKVKNQVASNITDSENSKEVEELKDRLNDATKQIQETSLENIKLKRHIKKLLEEKNSNVSNNTNIKPNYDEMKLKELAVYVKKFMLKNGCKEKPVDKQLLIAEFGATNVNRLVVQRFLVQKNNGYIL